MKILIIHHYGGLGGGLTSCLDIASMFKELNNNVTVAIPNPSDDVKRLFDRAGIEIDGGVPEVPVLNYHSACAGLVSAVVKYQLSKGKTKEWSQYLMSKQYDIVVLNSIVQVPLISVIKKLDTKCIIFIRETIRGDEKKGLNPQIAKSLSEADSVCFLTNYDKKSWKLSEDTNQYVIPDIVDIKNFPGETVQDMEQREVTYLYLGGLSYVKGAKDLLQAFQKMIRSGKDGELIILGETYEFYSDFGIIHKIIHWKDIKYVKECNKLIGLLNSDKKRVNVVGLTPNPGEWYMKSDIVVFPVKKIHQARPVYEAGYYKRTVILPDYQNFEDVVIDNYNGCYYKKNDIVSLACVMKNLAMDSVFRNRLAENNRTMYQNGHTYENAKDCLKVMLDEI